MNKELEKINLYAPLDRMASTWIADWLKEIKGKSVRGGWTRIYQLSINDVAKQFHVPVEDVVSAARGEQRR